MDRARLRWPSLRTMYVGRTESVHRDYIRDTMAAGAASSTSLYKLNWTGLGHAVRQGCGARASDELAQLLTFGARRSTPLVGPWLCRRYETEFEVYHFERSRPAGCRRPANHDAERRSFIMLPRRVGPVLPARSRSCSATTTRRSSGADRGHLMDSLDQRRLVRRACSHRCSRPRRGPTWRADLQSYPSSSSRSATSDELVADEAVSPLSRSSSQAFDTLLGRNTRSRRWRCPARDPPLVVRALPLPVARAASRRTRACRPRAPAAPARNACRPASRSPPPRASRPRGASRSRPRDADRDNGGAASSAQSSLLSQTATSSASGSSWRLRARFGPQ